MFHGSPREERQTWFSWASQCALPLFPPFCPPVYGFLLCMLLGRFRVGGSEHLRFPLRVCFCVAVSVCRVGCRCWNIAQWACFNEHSTAVSCHPSLPLANPNHSTMQRVLGEWAFLFFFFFLLALLCATKETRSHNILLHLIEGRVFNNYLVSMTCVTPSPSQQGERENLKYNYTDLHLVHSCVWWIRVKTC